MPPANTPAPEPTVAAPREFVADIHALAAARLEDCHDYANDGFSDETEQSDWEQEQARIRRIAETAEALLQPAEPAIPEQFRQWLQTLTRFDGQPFVEPIPSDLVEPGATGLRAKLNTALFSYAIAAVWNTDENGASHSYLGAIATRHGNGGRDLADGTATADTWRRIL